MKLFDPLTIKNMKLKNRIILPPMHLLLGIKNQRARAYYLERAKGGVGAVILAATSVDLFLDDEAWGRSGGVAKFLDNMKVFTDEIREAGAKIGVQLWHNNNYPIGNGADDFPGSEKVAPSATDDMRALKIDEIRTIVEKFALASERVKSSGFDFVELHGAHGYLLCQFFAKADNKRDDEYGGDVFGRMRFGLETVKSIRQAVGDDFPIFYRLGALEKRSEGITIRQSSLFAKELEAAGIDVMDVSIGRNSNHAASPKKNRKEGTFADLAASIKEKISSPVVAVGRINTPEIAESILIQKKADIVAIGRQLIADPYWPEKVLTGRTSEIVACLSCNSCYRPLRDNTWKRGDRICKVNERAGKEIEMPL